MSYTVNMENPSLQPELSIKSTEEELSHVAGRVLERERELRRQGQMPDRDTVIREQIRDYKTGQTERVLDSSFQMKPIEVDGLIMKLTPEAHDRRVEELVKILKEKGIKNVLHVIEKLGDAHLEDDFHRFLIQYVKEGFGVKGVSKRAVFYKALNMTLYEIIIPESPENEKTLREIVSGMEQFYAGMLSISGYDNPAENYIVIEIANSNGSEEFIFYASIPNAKKSTFEKQVLAIFPKAHVVEKADDYNIFNEKGISLGSYASVDGNAAFPLKTYEEFDHDPLNSILNSFSKINRDGEGASLQILIRPAGNYYAKRYGEAAERIKKGVALKEALGEESLAGGLFKAVSETVFGSKKKEDEKNKEPKIIDNKAVELIEKKTSSPIVSTSIRLIASAGERERAEVILSDLESAFKQFENPQRAAIKFLRLSEGKLRVFIRNFSFRVFSDREKIPLNLKELTSVIHFHTEALRGASQLKVLKSSSAPAPLSFPAGGTFLGINRYQGAEKKVYISDEDRLRHFYTIGQTGTGKSTLLKNMIIQDIQRGGGVAMIDPHGSDIEDVLRHIPPERMDDVIYFDPAYTERPMGLNMLEYDPRFPEQKTFVVNELFNIFQKLYGAVPESMGPMFEQYFRNSAMLVIEDPESGSTLLDVSRVLSNREFRAMKLSRCKNPIVVQFWKEVAEKAGGEAALANIVPYITSKFDVFLANDIMRPIVAQEKSAFNFRQIMDDRKILLVNLSKGRLGDINANLIGLILVGKILMASLSRVNSAEGAPVGGLPPFYLYIDEFQNITTPSIATILSEARKYKLSLSIAHQFIGQLEDNIKNAVFGNVGTIVAFRVGSDDAEYLAKQFEPVFSARQLVNIENRNAYIKMLVNGTPEKPFNMETQAVSTEVLSEPREIKSLSYEKYGRERQGVEEEIGRKYADFSKKWEG